MLSSRPSSPGTVIPFQPVSDRVENKVNGRVKEEYSRTQHKEGKARIWARIRGAISSWEKVNHLFLTL